MARPYKLKRRAEQQAETRQRIVDAAVDLHRSVGPALTTVSMVAEHSGVQRHTVYAHFPDDRSLFLACSAAAADRDPPPDATPWRAIADARERLRRALPAIYGWYERNADLAACVLRDAEVHALTKEMFELRIRPQMTAWQDVLGKDLDSRQRAILQLALSFFTWRTLARDAGLARDAATAAMLQAIIGDSA
jgi:AcrR family transcriptional regulator